MSHGNGKNKVEYCTGQHSPADGTPLKVPAATCTGSTASPGTSSQPRRSLATKGNPRYAILGKWTKLRKQATINRERPCAGTADRGPRQCLPEWRNRTSRNTLNDD